MRVACVSDFHGKLPVIQPCDLLLIAGDITPVTDHTPGYQRFWLENAFRPWLVTVPARHILGVAGNHDFLFQTSASLIAKDLRWNYLQDSGVEIEGLKIYGTPWQPWFCDWAFNSPKENPEAFLAEKFAAIPDDTDILLTHGAPFGYGDTAPVAGKNAGQHVGSTALMERIRQVSPALAVFGHLHSGHGLYEIEGARRKVLLANASIVDDNYITANLPLKFEVTRTGSTLSISPID
jgi:Icc-related predicted phosphoesterase